MHVVLGMFLVVASLVLAYMIFVRGVGANNGSHANPAGCVMAIAVATILLVIAVCGILIVAYGGNYAN